MANLSVHYKIVAVSDAELEIEWTVGKLSERCSYPIPIDATTKAALSGADLREWLKDAFRQVVYERQQRRAARAPLADLVGTEGDLTVAV